MTGCFFFEFIIRVLPHTNTKPAQGSIVYRHIGTNKVDFTDFVTLWRSNIAMENGPFEDVY